MKSMEYYRVPAGAGWLYVRVVPKTGAAEEFDLATRSWEQMDAWYHEIYHNGRGEQLTQADALDAVGHLQSA